MRLLLIVLGVAAVLGALIFAGNRHGAALEERNQLAEEVAVLNADESCGLAWVEGREAGRFYGVQPMPHERAEVIVRGPPRIIDCPLFDTDTIGSRVGRQLPYMRVTVTCTDLDRECVDAEDVRLEWPR